MRRKENASETLPRLFRNSAAAFVEGLRFRRLANQQECDRLTVEWDPAGSMIETAIVLRQRPGPLVSPFSRTIQCHVEKISQPTFAR